MNLFSILEQTARRYHDKDAVYAGPQSVATYGQLYVRSLSLATEVRSRMQPGGRLSIVSANCTQFLEILFGCWAAGMTLVPINAKLHPREIADIIEDAEVSVVMVSEELRQTIAQEVQQRGRELWLVTIGSPEYQALVQGGGGKASSVDHNDVAWLFYTSGTTGRPKGAMLTHRNLMAMTVSHLADYEDLKSDHSIIHAAPMSHGSGLCILPYVARGASHLVPESRGFDPAEFLDICDRRAGCGAFLAPTMVRRLRIEAQSSNRRPAGLHSIIYGGGPMYLAEIRSALDHFGSCFQQLYGQGEAPMTITGLRKGDFDAPTDDVLASVGWPRQGVEVAVFDSDDNPVPVDQVGEIVCRGDVVMKGYWNNPDASLTALRGGWLHTGDLGVMNSEGRLTLHDRSKDLIIAGGSNIYPREVEEVLLSFPGVAEAAVVGEKDVEWGEHVVAFIVTDRAANVTEAALDIHCLQRIARFKRPRRYVFLEQLPKNSYGKVLKRELSQSLSR